ncbi:MAG: isochorismate synthase [Bacteroidota bacterium]|nr:isochorismate synthase [Bacteroidota bacterium]
MNPAASSNSPFSLSPSGNKAWAIYRLPGISDVHYITGQLDAWHGQDGFIVTPFSGEPLVIRADESITFSSFPDIRALLHPEANVQFTVSQAVFCSAVAHALKNIDGNDFRKVVLARAERLYLKKRFSPAALFYALLAEYPTAFVYVLFTPMHGLWMGASPELLLAVNGSSVNTMSLAGTSRMASEREQVTFSPKENEEQQIVTSYIQKVLTKFCDSVVVKPKNTRQAGRLLHYITEISGELAGSAPGLPALIKELHPTPAVGGTPKDEALAFLKQHEKLDRRLYSGYLGPWLLEGNSTVFVNLRCMQLFTGLALLYAGAGIVKGSDPEKEWQETSDKMDTLRRFL